MQILTLSLLKTNIKPEYHNFDLAKINCTWKNSNVHIHIRIDISQSLKRRFSKPTSKHVLILVTQLEVLFGLVLCTNLSDNPLMCPFHGYKLEDSL